MDKETCYKKNLYPDCAVVKKQHSRKNAERTTSGLAQAGV